MKNNVFWISVHDFLDPGKNVVHPSFVVNQPARREDLLVALVVHLDLFVLGEHPGLGSHGHAHLQLQEHDAKRLDGLRSLSRRESVGRRR